jgi:hypothetical protein
MAAPILLNRHKIFDSSEHGTAIHNIIRKMAVPIPQILYTLTNSYTSASYQLASSSKNLVLEPTSPFVNHQWYLTPTDKSKYYRLHTAASGTSYALDVKNTDGEKSTQLCFAKTGDYSGQFWRLDAWGDGTWRLSNDFTGKKMHLDVYADTYEPHLAKGDCTGQHWTFKST